MGRYAMRLAVITDVHYRPADPACASRAELLERAIRYANQVIQPDLALILGDLLEDVAASEALAALERLRASTETIQAPTIIIPGNHDPATDAFYTVFERPAPFLEVEGIRVVPFIDPEEPEYNARRLPADLARFAAVRAGFDGPIISVQHVPLFPPGASDCPFHYVNAEEIMDKMQENNVGLAISGHYHAGMDLFYRADMGFLAAPALCNAPFTLLEINYDGVTIGVVEHRLE